jgi:hypothetical protein
MTKILLLMTLICAFARPAAAQGGPVTDEEADALSIRGVGFVTRQTFAAKTTFDAV